MSFRHKGTVGEKAAPLTASLKPVTGDGQPGSAVAKCRQTPEPPNAWSCEDDNSECGLHADGDNSSNITAMGFPLSLNMGGPRTWGPLPGDLVIPEAIRFKRAALRLYSQPHAGGLREGLPFPTSLTGWDYGLCPQMLNQLLALSPSRSGECALRSQRSTPECTLMLYTRRRVPSADHCVRRAAGNC